MLISEPANWVRMASITAAMYQEAIFTTQAALISMATIAVLV